MKRAGTSNGRLFLLAGGFRGGRTDAVLEAMLGRLPGASPRVAYVGAASGDDKPFFNRMKLMLTRAGAGAVELVAFSNPAKAGEELRRAELVYMSGGDVEAGMQALEAVGADGILRDLFEGGKPFMGLSAGSIMLGRSWVRWRNPEDDATAELFRCLGFAPFVCDTHDEESDWGELKICLALAGPGSVGYGIPSGGGLIVEPDGKVMALGCSPVVVTTEKTVAPRRNGVRTPQSLAGWGGGSLSGLTFSRSSMRASTLGT